MAWVYILQTRASKFYIGSTKNLEKRFEHHLGGHTPSTKRLGVEKLLFKQEYETLQEARRVEKRLKNLKRKDYIEKIIKDGYIKTYAQTVKPM